MIQKITSQNFGTSISIRKRIHIKENIILKTQSPSLRHSESKTYIFHISMVFKGTQLIDKHLKRSI